MAMGPRITAQTWADTTSNRPVLVYPPMLKFGVGTLRVTDEMRAEDGTYTQTLAYRFCQVTTDRPGAWNVTANTRIVDGVGTTDIDVSGTTDQMWVQVALMGKSGGAMAGAFSALQVQTSGSSRIIAARTIDLQAIANSGEALYLPLSAPFEALDLQSMMFAAQIYGLESTSLTFQPIWRTFDARLDSPNAWNTLDSSQNVSSNTFYNSGTETTAPGTTQYAQPGIKISGTGIRGTMKIQVAGLF